MQSLTLEERQDKNARRRAQRQSLPPEQRQALLNRVKENYTARRAIPCAESISMQCPELGGSPLINPLCSIPTSFTNVFEIRSIGKLSHRSPMCLS
jgi:hypothetical protein